jgi:MFS transporter, PAT family, beta-lactamase induction signal transducer AmpG
MRAFLAQLWRIYSRPVLLSMFVLGFASGTPLMSVFSELSFWLREVGVERSTIGFFYWVTLVYSIKVFFGPIVDRLNVPYLTRWLGRRRSWMIVAIAGTIAGLLIIAFSDPQPGQVDWTLYGTLYGTPFVRLTFISSGLIWTLIGAFTLAASGAVLDTAMDGWRIESAEHEQQANMVVAYTYGYRLAIIGSSGTLALAEHIGWPGAYMVSAAAMLGTLVFTFFIREPKTTITRLKSANVFMQAVEAYWVPLWQIGKRLKWWLLPVLSFILVYRLSDFTMGVMASPLYADLGYAKDVVGAIRAGPGLISTLIGAAIGGLMTALIGRLWALMGGALITLVTNGAFAFLAAGGEGQPALHLAAIISADNFASGYVTVVFIAYMSSLTDPLNAATQYALFSSVYSIGAKMLAGWSGVLADAVEYEAFFIMTALYTIPAAMLLLFIILKGTPAARGEMDFATADGETSNKHGPAP